LPLSSFFLQNYYTNFSWANLDDETVNSEIKKGENPYVDGNIVFVYAPDPRRGTQKNPQNAFCAFDLDTGDQVFKDTQYSQCIGYSEGVRYMLNETQVGAYKGDEELWTHDALEGDFTEEFVRLHYMSDKYIFIEVDLFNSNLDYEDVIIEILDRETGKSVKYLRDLTSFHSYFVDNMALYYTRGFGNYNLTYPDLCGKCDTTTLFKIDIDTLEEEWSLQNDEYNYILTTRNQVLDDVLFVMLYDNERITGRNIKKRIQCIDINSGKPIKTFEFDKNINTFLVGDGYLAIETDTGVTYYSLSIDANDSGNATPELLWSKENTSFNTIDGDELYAYTKPDFEGDSYDVSISCSNKATGESIWEKPIRGRIEGERFRPIGAPVVFFEGNTWIVCNKDGVIANNFYYYDFFNTEPFIYPDELYIDYDYESHDQNKGVVVYDLYTGLRKESSNLDRSFLGKDGDKRLFLYFDKLRLETKDEIIWTLDEEEMGNFYSRSRYIFSDKYLITNTYKNGAKRIVIIDKSTGEVVKIIESTSKREPDFFVCDNKLFYSISHTVEEKPSEENWSANTSLGMLDLETLEIVWENKNQKFVFFPNQRNQVDDGKLYVMASNQIDRYKIEECKTILEFDIETGRILRQLEFDEYISYFAVSDGKLYVEDNYNLSCYAISTEDGKNKDEDEDDSKDNDNKDTGIPKASTEHVDTSCSWVCPNGDTNATNSVVAECLSETSEFEYYGGIQLDYEIKYAISYGDHIITLSKDGKLYCYDTSVDEEVWRYVDCRVNWCFIYKDNLVFNFANSLYSRTGITNRDVTQCRKIKDFSQVWSNDFVTIKKFFPTINGNIMTSSDFKTLGDELLQKVNLDTGEAEFINIALPENITPHPDLIACYLDDYIIMYEEQNNSYKLYAFDIEKNEVVWSREVVDQYYYRHPDSIQVRNDKLYVSYGGVNLYTDKNLPKEDVKKMVECIKIETGDTLWSYESPGIKCAIDAMDDNHLVALQNETLMCFEPKTGAILWKKEAMKLGGKAIIVGDSIFCSIADEPETVEKNRNFKTFVARLDINTGETKWQSSYSDYFSNILYSDGKLIAEVVDQSSTNREETLYYLAYWIDSEYEQMKTEEQDSVSNTTEDESGEVTKLEAVATIDSVGLYCKSNGSIFGFRKSDVENNTPKVSAKIESILSIDTNTLSVEWEQKYSSNLFFQYQRCITTPPVYFFEDRWVVCNSDGTVDEIQYADIDGGSNKNHPDLAYMHLNKSIGNKVFLTSKNNLNCYEAETGKLLYSFDMETFPFVSDDNILIYGNGYNIVAFSGEVLWKRNSRFDLDERYIPYDSSNSEEYFILGSTIAQCYENAYTKILIIDKSDGSIVKEIDNWERYGGYFYVHDEYLYYTTIPLDNDKPDNQKNNVTKPRHTLSRMNLSNLEVEWSFQNPNYNYYPFIPDQICNGKMYVLASDTNKYYDIDHCKFIHQIDITTGEVLNIYEFDKNIEYYLISDGYLYVETADELSCYPVDLDAVSESGSEPIPPETDPRPEPSPPEVEPAPAPISPETEPKTEASPSEDEFNLNAN